MKFLPSFDKVRIAHCQRRVHNPDEVGGAVIPGGIRHMLGKKQETVTDHSGQA